MPLFTDAITADCHHLNDSEFGLYMRILILIWRSPNCRIPNDESWITRKLNKPSESFMMLIKEFCISDGNFITQKRLLKEWNYISKTRKKNTASAKHRWNNEKDICKRNAPTPTPTPTPIKEERKKEKEKTIKKENAEKYSAEFDIFWSSYPKNRGSKFTAFKAYNSAIMKGATHDNLERSATAFSNYISRAGTELQYVPHGATWLNQRRWETDYSSLDAGNTRAGKDGISHESRWITEGDRIAAKYLAQAAFESGQSTSSASAQQNLCLATTIRKN